MTIIFCLASSHLHEDDYPRKRDATSKVPTPGSIQCWVMYSHFFCIFTFPSLTSFNLLRDALLVFSFTLYTLLLSVHINFFMQVDNKWTFLNIRNLMKSKGKGLPPNGLFWISLISLHPHPRLAKFCVSIPSQTPLQCNDLGCHLLPSPAPSPTSSAPLSCSHFHCSLPLSHIFRPILAYPFLLLLVLKHRATSSARNMGSFKELFLILVIITFFSSHSIWKKKKSFKMLANTFFIIIIDFPLQWMGIKSMIETVWI